jgi:hypothetical protein
VAAFDGEESIKADKIGLHATLREKNARIPLVVCHENVIGFNYASEKNHINTADFIKP